MKKLLAVVASHGVALLVGIMLLWQFGGSLWNWRRQQKLETKPVVLEQTKAAAKAERVSLSEAEALALCRGLQTIAPKEASKVRPKPLKPSKGQPASSEGQLLAGGIDDQPRILDEVTVPKLPYGGVAEVSLVPSAAFPVVVVTPNARPWLEGGSRWRLSALVGMDVLGDAQGTIVVPSVDWVGLRTGRISHGASVTYCPKEAVVAGYRASFE